MSMIGIVPVMFIALKVALFVAGVIWCKEIFGRWREDVSSLRELKDLVRRGAIVVIWLITLGIIFLMARFVWGIARPLVEMFRES